MTAKKRKSNCDEDEDEEGFDSGGRGFLSGFVEKRWVQNLENRVITINFPISDNLIDLAVLPILQINAHDDNVASQIPTYIREPITVYINTDGGSIDPCFSLVSAIEASKTPVHTVLLGKAYSAGFIILLAGHKRSCQIHSSGLYHQGSSITGGTFADIEEYSNHFMRIQERIHELILRRTNISPEMLDDIFRSKHDWYLEAIDMYELGVVDEIIGVDMKALKKSLKKERKQEEKAEKKSTKKKAKK